MGTKTVPCFANIYSDKFEQLHVYTYHKHLAAQGGGITDIIPPPK
jgi:hypothetical protein